MGFEERIGVGLHFSRHCRRVRGRKAYGSSPALLQARRLAACVLYTAKTPLPALRGGHVLGALEDVRFRHAREEMRRMRRRWVSMSSAVEGFPNA
jgi:hypothetical protein